MLTDPALRSQVDKLWDTLWSGGLSNPLDAIEQFSYLLFLKRMDDEENRRESAAKRRDEAYTPRDVEEMRWRTWTRYDAARMLSHVRDRVFPTLKEMGGENSSFQRYMANAEFKINKATLLVEATKLIDSMRIGARNQDVQGDLYEYMLGKLSTAGRNGQFRTPRHIIRMMTRMLDPKPDERIGDLAAGTAGFLVNAYQHILARNTPPESITYDDEGEMHGADGSLLTPEQRDFLQQRAFRGYDNDSGMTMLRIGSMNLMLHGLHSPRFFYKDTLGKDFDEPGHYDVILMNPPFKGAVDANDMSVHLPGDTKKTELLFVHQILRALDSGGRAAVIVPDGVLFGSSNAHRKLRAKLVDENRLDGVISMPSGVFKPYAGVSTAALFFTKGGTTDTIWFYDMAFDGYTLDDKRTPTPSQTDIPDILDCWNHRRDAAFNEARVMLLAAKRAEIAPLHTQRLALEREIHRLRYETALRPEDAAYRAELDAAQGELAALRAELDPLKAEIARLARLFWVTKAQARANKYDLSASRYHTVDREEVYYEEPQVTIERIRTLERAIAGGLVRIEEMLTK
jgi:type I restriction enzyme M protein